MKKLTTSLCLIFAVLVAGSGTCAALPPCVNGILHNCDGTQRFPSGNTYDGEFRKGKRHGQGTFTFGPNSRWAGDTYSGSWRRGKPDGTGTYTHGSGSKWPGARYVGEYRNGKKHGQGTYTFSDDNRYVGEFRNGRVYGVGTFILANGKLIKGDWKNGKFRRLEKTRDAVPIGGMPPDPDRLQNAKNRKTQQSPQKCLPGANTPFYNCFGSHTYEADTGLSGDKYVGHFQDDKPSGEGTYTFKDGSKYVGQFRDGQFNGEGVLYDADGTVNKEGVWANDEFQYDKKIIKRRQTASNTEKQNRRSGNKTSNIGNPTPTSFGTGFSITDAGHILTNNHVISKCDTVVFQLKGDDIKSEIIARDGENDLALLKSDFEPASVFGISETNAELMDDIWVVGFPFAKFISDGVKVTKGVVSSQKGFGDRHSQFQIDAAVQPGNSGGPIIDQKGNVVGITVATVNKFAFLKKKGFFPENTNFGIKSSIAHSFLQSNGLELPVPGKVKLNGNEMRKLVGQGVYLIKCLKTAQ